jgi:hypothetical protein
MIFCFVKKNSKQKFIRATSYFSNVLLQSLDSIITNDKPQFEGSKFFTKRNLPVLKGKNYFSIHFSLKNECNILVLPCNQLPDLCRKV